MAAKVGQVIIDFLLNTAKFESDLNKATRTFKKTGQELSSIGKTWTTGVTLPIAAVGVAVTKMALDIDDGVDKIRSGTGATGAALASLSGSMRSVMATVPDSVGNVSEAIAGLNTRLGLTGKPLETMATQMLNLARLTGSEVGPIIAASTRLFGDWSVSTEKQSSTMDMLYKTTQSTGIGMQRLMELVVQYGAPLRSLGFDIESAAVMMGKWEKEGVNIETVLAGLKKGLMTFAKAGMEPAQALEQMVGAIKGAKTEGEAMAIAMKVFGAKAGPDLARAIIEGRFSIEDLKKSIAGSKETINSAAADVSDFAEQWGIVRNKIMLAAEPLGVALLNAFSNLIPYIEKALNWLTKLAQTFSGLPEGMQLTILGIAGLAAAVGPLLMAFGAINSGVASALTLFKTLSGATGAVGASFSVLGSVAAVIGVFWAGWKLGDLLRNFEWVRNAADGFANMLVKLGMLGPSAADSMKNLEKDTSLLAARMKEAGVNVDRMQGESIPNWNKRVMEAVEAHKALTPKLDQVSTKLKDNKVKTDQLGGATGLLSKEMETLKKSTAEAVSPMDALSKKLADQMSLGFSKNALIKAYADDIIKASQRQKELGGNISAATQQIVDQAMRLQAFAAAVKPMDDVALKVKEMTLLGVPLAEAVKKYADEITNAASVEVEFTGTLRDSVVGLTQQAMGLKAAEAAAKSKGEFDDWLTKIGQDYTKGLESTADELKVLGRAMSLGLDVTKKSGESTEEWTKRLQGAMNEMDKLAGAVMDAQHPMDRLTEQITKQMDMGFSKDELIRIYADEILNAANKQIELGGSISSTSRELANQAQAYVNHQEVVKKWRNVANDAALNVGDTLAGMLQDGQNWIVEKVGKWAGPFSGFAKAATNALLEGFFNPFKSMLNELGNSIGSWLTGLLTGKGGGGGLLGSITGLFTGGKGGGGILSGLFKGGGLAGSLGGLLGLGGSGVSAGMAGYAASLGLSTSAAAAATGGTAAAAGGAGAAGAGAGGLGALGHSLAAFMTNPVTMIAAAAAAAGFGVYKLVDKIQGPNSWEAMSKEVSRDYGGVSLSPKVMEEFSKQFGISEKEAWDVRKNITTSPQFLAMMASAAEQQGKLDAYMKSLENVGTSWGTFNFRTPFEQGMQSGDFGALNDMWQNISKLGDKGFAKRVEGGTSDAMLLAQAVEALNAAQSSTPVEITTQTPIEVNINGAGEDLVTRVKSEVIPILIREMTGGNSGLREAIVRAYETTSRGLTSRVAT